MPIRTLTGTAKARETIRKRPPAGSGQKPFRITSSSVICTDLKTYDKKDPFMAMNILLKLLGTIPYRKGASQYKFTPEEQRLAIHLVTLVEPFVSSTPSLSRTALIRQPTEMLDLIASHLDNRGDLLNLALTCKRIRDVVIPRHFEYRVIKAKVSSIRVWNHLTVHRSLAANVRMLEILDERTSLTREVVPSRIMESDTDLESTDDELGLHDKYERYLVIALSRMTGLSCFKWSCNHSLVSLQNVWPVLLRNGSLKEMQLNDNRVFAELQDSESETSKVASNKASALLPIFHSASLRSTRNAFGAVANPHLGRIRGMLDRCPNLNSLDIQYLHPKQGPSMALTGPISIPSADDLLLFGRWPNLTSLTLSNMRCSTASGQDAAISFLLSHPFIQTLNLEFSSQTSFTVENRSGANRLVLMPNSLPHLRDLKANRAIVHSILECPLDEGRERPLEVLRGLTINTMRKAIDEEFMAALKLGGRSLRRAELTGWQEMADLKTLSEAVPNLTSLDIGKKLGRNISSSSSSTPSGSLIATNTLEWATLLSGFPNLHTFQSVRFFYEVSPHIHQSGSGANCPTDTTWSTTDRSRVKKNDEVASILAWKNLRLRKLDHWEEDGGKMVVLIRDGSSGERDREREQVRWEVRKAKV